MALNGQHLGTGDHLETRPLFSPPQKKHVQQKEDGNTPAKNTTKNVLRFVQVNLVWGGLKLDWNLWLEKRQT